MQDRSLPPRRFPWSAVLVLSSACCLRCAALDVWSPGSAASPLPLSPSAPLPREEGAPAARTARSGARAPAPFLAAFVIALDPAKYDRVRQNLAADGVGERVAQVGGDWDAKNITQVEAAVSFLKEVGNNKSLVWHLRGKLSACSHASPSKPLRWSDVLQGCTSAMPVYDNLDELFKAAKRTRHPDCSSSTMKTIAITAAHVKLWKDLADGSLPASQSHPAAGSEDGWYLILEDDVEFCPGWVSRLQEELQQAPADADVLKLSWIGRWNNKSFVGPFLEVPADPYEGITTDWMKDLIIKAFKPHHGVFREVLGGNTLKTFSLSCFFGGSQAYLVRRSSLPKMMQRLNGTRFDYVDLTLMMIGKTYAWRRVLAVEDGVRSQQLEEEAKIAAKHLQRREEAAKKANAEGKVKEPPKRRRERKKGSALLALSSEHSDESLGGNGRLESTHVSVPMCGKEPEDPADLTVVGGAGKKRRHRRKRVVRHGAKGDEVAATGQP